jgi:hypothetical protein
MTSLDDWIYSPPQVVPHYCPVNHWKQFIELTGSRLAAERYETFFLSKKSARRFASVQAYIKTGLRTETYIRRVVADWWHDPSETTPKR